MTLSQAETGFRSTRSEKIAVGTMIAGGVAILVGALFYSRAAKKRTGMLRDTLGRVETRTKKGGMVLTHHYDPEMPIEQRVKLLQGLVWNSVNNPESRDLALAITGNGKREVTVGKRKYMVTGANCPARDGACEAEAIYRWVKDNIRYTGDVAPVMMPSGEVEGVDLFQTSQRTAQMGGGDCLPAGTLLLTDRFEFTPIEQLVIGQRIWGRNAWTEVKDVWSKGVLPIDTIFLNNGSTFKATADHKVYVALCKQHPPHWSDGKSCACPMDNRVVERITVGQLEPGMVLVQPERIDFGTEAMDPRRALIEGYYLADGWKSHDSDFDIAGRDGRPKEAQKAEIAALCAELGIETTMFEKSIRVRDKAWAERISLMGGNAPTKHALSINLNEEAAGALLRGIMADSGKNANGNGRTFTTTSRMLAMQVRVLQRMFGISCSERYIVDHGGLGQHPIWRLGVRDHNRSDGKSVKLLRVNAVERAVVEAPVYDISTADHYVYLPEADVTVSNCDDHSVLAATMLTLNGIPAKFRITAPTRNDDWAHIYPLAGLPKTRPSKWVALDTTLPGEMFGREAPYGKHKDFVA